MRQGPANAPENAFGRSIVHETCIGTNGVSTSAKGLQNLGYTKKLAKGPSVSASLPMSEADI
jgi:hypothetical protein